MKDGTVSRITPEVRCPPSYLRLVTDVLLEQPAVKTLLWRYHHPELQVWVSADDGIERETPLWRAHGNWSRRGFEGVETPEGLPRRPSGEGCPSGLLKVEMELGRRREPRMGHHYNFEGYYLSLLVFHWKKEIWDARGEPTDR